MYLTKIFCQTLFSGLRVICRTLSQVSSVSCLQRRIFSYLLSIYIDNYVTCSLIFKTNTASRRCLTSFWVNNRIGVAVLMFMTKLHSILSACGDILKFETPTLSDSNALSPRIRIVTQLWRLIGERMVSPNQGSDFQRSPLTLRSRFVDVQI